MTAHHDHHDQDGQEHVAGSGRHALLGGDGCDFRGDERLGAVAEELALLGHAAFGLAHGTEVLAREDDEDYEQDGEDGIEVQGHGGEHRSHRVFDALIGEEADDEGAPGVQGDEDAFGRRGGIADVGQLFPRQLESIEQGPGHGAGDEDTDAGFDEDDHADDPMGEHTVSALGAPPYETSTRFENHRSDVADLIYSVANIAPFDGRIDEVSIYKTALNTGQIASLYEAGSLVLYLPLDDPPGASEFQDALEQHNGACSGDNCPLAGVWVVSLA